MKVQSNGSVEGAQNKNLYNIYIYIYTSLFSPSPPLLSPPSLSGLFLLPFAKHEPTTLTYFHVIPGELYSPNKHAEADKDALATRRSRQRGRKKKKRLEISEKEKVVTVDFVVLYALYYTDSTQRYKQIDADRYKQNKQISSHKDSVKSWDKTSFSFLRIFLCYYKTVL